MRSQGNEGSRGEFKGEDFGWPSQPIFSFKNPYEDCLLVRLSFGSPFCALSFITQKPSFIDAKLKKERFHKSLHLFPTVVTTISPFPPKTGMKLISLTM